MSVFEIPKKSTLQLLNKQKYNKIYVFSRKKYNPFSATAIPLKPSQTLQIHPNHDKKSTQKLDCLYNTTQQLLQSYEPKDHHSFSLEYQESQGLDSLLKKRKTLKQRLAYHFQNSTLKSIFDRERTSKLQPFRPVKAITSKSLLSNFKRMEKSKNRTLQIEIRSDQKKSSLPDLNRFCTLQTFSQKRSLRRKSTRGKTNIFPAKSSCNQSEFIRTGIINGQKILKHNSNQNQESKIKFEIKSQRLQTQITAHDQKYKSSSQNGNNSQRDSCYPFVKIDSKNSFQKKIIQRKSRKNIIQLRKGKSLQNQNSKMLNLTSKSLIKIQKLSPQKQTQNILKR